MRGAGVSWGSGWCAWRACWARGGGGVMGGDLLSEVIDVEVVAESAVV